MPPIPCTICSDPAIAGIMMYGPEGSTQDYCPQHLAEWSLQLLQGVWPDALAPEARAAESAPAAEAGTDANGTAGTGKRRGRARETPPQEAEEPVPASAEVPGAEHDG